MSIFVNCVSLLLTRALQDGLVRSCLIVSGKRGSRRTLDTAVGREARSGPMTRNRLPHNKIRCCLMTDTLHDETQNSSKRED